MKTMVRSTETIPIGMFMKNIQCQDQLSVIQPPSSGPIIGPNIMPTPKAAIAMPC